jgi:hypothetical protein
MGTKTRLYVLMIFQDENYQIKIFTTKKGVWEYSNEVADLPSNTSKKEFFNKISYHPLENNSYTWSKTIYNGGVYGDDMVTTNYSVTSESTR